ncbi:MAG: phosphatidate cytidylyltransferase [Pseudomonadota bacterium]
MLKHRLITGTILLLLTIAAVMFLPIPYFIGVVSVVMLLAAWEWARLIAYQRWVTRLGYVVLVGVVMILEWYAPILPVLFATLVWWFIACYWIVNYPGAKQVWSNGVWVRGIMGILVLVPAWLSLNVIRYAEQGRALTFFLFILVWASDIGAYFIGKAWGKHPLASSVSPKKTIEGLVGGFLCALLVAWIASMMGIFSPINGSMIIALGAVVSLFAIVGDLFESMAKRSVGVKDTGHYLPGHGGLLDRIDSLLAAAPIFLLGLILLN